MFPKCQEAVLLLLIPICKKMGERRVKNKCESTYNILLTAVHLLTSPSFLCVLR